MGVVLHSVKTTSHRRYGSWEAWIEQNGRVIKSTLDFGFTENSAHKKALKRWEKFNRDDLVDGTHRETPL